MFSQSTNIVNCLKSLGKTNTNVDIVNKLLVSLLKSWKLKVTAIEEVNDLKILSLDHAWFFDYSRDDSR